MATRKGKTDNSAETTVESGAIETVTITVPADFSAKHSDWTLTLDQLRNMPPKGIAYLLANGFTQSITDAGAISKDDKAKLVDEAHKADPDGDWSEERDAEVVSNAVHQWRDERYADILAGKVGSRAGGTRSTPVETIMRRLAEIEVKGALAKNETFQGLDAKARAAALKANVEKHLERAKDRLRAAAEAELAAAKERAQDVQISL